MSDSSIRLQKLVTEQEFGFLAPVESKLQEVERQIAEMFPGDVPYVQEAGKHISQSGGKRLRPIVLLLCAKLCGYEGELDTAYACIVECIHTATLVHDDIIDKAEVRRGKASINSLFGDHITVLFGDYLYLKAMKRALDIGSLEILNLLSNATLEMIAGELFQLSRSGDVGLKEHEYFEMIRKKTALIFQACGRIAGTIAGVTEEKKDALAGYALNVGISFQLIDDVLDFVADEVVLGKPVNNDLREGKMTLPLIHLVQKGNPEDAEKILWFVKKRDISDITQDAILEILNRYGCLDYTVSKAAEFAGRAVRHLDRFGDSELKRHLVRLPDFILSRNS